MTTIVTCGGRALADRGLVFRTLNELRAELGVTVVAHGACGQEATRAWLLANLKGADRLVEDWARERALVTRWYPAPWELCPDARARSKAARDRVVKMFETEQPKLLVAFPGGSGTLMTMAVARLFHVPVRSLAVSS